MMNTPKRITGENAAARVAVCSWSLKPSSAHDLAESLRKTGIQNTQLALRPLRCDPSNWHDVREVMQKNGIGIVSGMFSAEAEDYSSLATIRLTGGLAPDATWEANQRHFEEDLVNARQLEIPFVTLHAGFIPPDPSDATYRRILDRIGKLADLAEAADIAVGLETGQESAQTLATFLRSLARSNIGVNFDPANMILYAMGDPLEAIEVLAPWLRQVHIKDAVPAREAGVWGREMPVGQGQVDWGRFFSLLQQIGFRGPLCIEREGGAQRVEDILQARELIALHLGLRS
jgi:L-ribulose-5-phosphate 3-epimerase